jgi:MFS family permease
MSPQAPASTLVSPALVSDDERASSPHLPNPKQPGVLNGNFWILYGSSFVIDFGLCLYFFMFSLFLVEHRFPEHAIGLITAALTVGAIAGTLPASFLSRRLGLRTMMLAYSLLAPLCFAARTLFLQMPAQIALAFLAGVAMSIWSVCFSPTLAKLTTKENRAFGFSLFIVTGIGSGAIAGLVGGYLPRMFNHPGRTGAPTDGIKIVLLLACAILGLAAFGLFRLRLEEVSRVGGRAITGFLVQFAVAIGVWNFAIGFFTPFANVYLATQLKVPLPRIGLIYTVSQVFQIAAILIAPLLYRKIGLVAGIALTQIGTASMLWGLAHASAPSSAIGIYVLFCGLQWMSGAGISTLLMNRTPEQYRSHATATQNIVNLVAQAGSAALAGKLFEQFGYSRPLLLNGGIAALAAVLLYALLGREARMDIGSTLRETKA